MLEVDFLLKIDVVCFPYITFSVHRHTMARPSIMIADLKKGNNVWKMATHVVDMWIVKEQNRQQHFERIIQDNRVFIVVVTILSTFQCT